MFEPKEDVPDYSQMTPYEAFKQFKRLFIRAVKTEPQPVKDDESNKERE